jgi:N4-gp56 family major capsid protein
MTTSGDISNRTALYAVARMLYRATPFLVFEKFGQTYVLPNNSTKVAKFRRFEALDATPNTLTEGVTPSAKTLSVSDVECTVVQYGDLITITDVVNDTNEDPVLKNGVEVLGEQAAEMIENVRFGVLKAGTNVYYAGTATTRTGVNTPITRALQRKITRFLKGQKARMITQIVKSDARYGTQAVAPSFVAVCHPDCDSDIRDMSGFKDVIDYGSASAWENEIGSVEGVRYVYSTIITPWEDAGGAYAGSGVAMTSTSGTNADVYPILYIARDAYGIVPLKGQTALSPMVVNPKPTDSDPLAQRGHISWKSMQTCVILNQAWMVRAEVAVTA